MYDKTDERGRTDSDVRMYMNKRTTIQCARTTFPLVSTRKSFFEESSHEKRRVLLRRRGTRAGPTELSRRVSLPSLARSVRGIEPIVKWFARKSPVEVL